MPHLTESAAIEILSLVGERDELGLRAAISVAGWSRVAPAVGDDPRGVARFAAFLGAPSYPLDEAIGVIAAEARELLARHEAGQGHEQANEQRGGVHAPTIGHGNRPVQLGDA